MKKVKYILILVIILRVCVQTYGIVEFTDGVAHNISYIIEDDVRIDYQNQSQPSTANLLQYGYIWNLYSYNQSLVNIEAGTIRDYLKAYEDSAITINNGSIGRYRQWNNSYSGLEAYDSSTVNVHNGSICDLTAYNNSEIIMTGGSVWEGLYAYGNSKITFSNGTVRALDARDNSQVNMSGGSVEELIASVSGRINISGGLVRGYLSSRNNGQVLLSGGSVSGSLIVYDNSNMIIDGSNFAIDGVPVSICEIKSLLGSEYWRESYRTLSGVLANGDIINNQFRIGDDAKIILIPEPATILFFGFGLFVLRNRKQ